MLPPKDIRFWRILVQDLPAVIGVILIWRGAWILLDHLEVRLWGAPSLWFAVVTIVVGVILIYIVGRRTGTHGLF
ncbi:hypothetical protein C4552_01970 [Candidatus Parcubacteria bacterium]|nr:MAG: hypothetical protein C4552_01970 [Candidatus Parcubacteria bacterium]